MGPFGATHHQDNGHYKVHFLKNRLNPIATILKIAEKMPNSYGTWQKKLETVITAAEPAKEKKPYTAAADPAISAGAACITPALPVGRIMPTPQNEISADKVKLHIFGSKNFIDTKIETAPASNRNEPINNVLSYPILRDNLGVKAVIKNITKALATIKYPKVVKLTPI